MRRFAELCPRQPSGRRRAGAARSRCRLAGSRAPRLRGNGTERAGEAVSGAARGAAVARVRRAGGAARAGGPAAVRAHRALGRGRRADRCRAGARRRARRRPVRPARRAAGRVGRRARARGGRMARLPGLPARRPAGADRPRAAGARRSPGRGAGVLRPPAAPRRAGALVVRGPLERRARTRAERAAGPAAAARATAPRRPGAVLDRCVAAAPDPRRPRARRGRRARAHSRRRPAAGEHRHPPALAAARRPARRVRGRADAGCRPTARPISPAHGGRWSACHRSCSWLATDARCAARRSREPAAPRPIPPSPPPRGGLSPPRRRTEPRTR